MKNSGSVLFIILIAVALFAALCYAVTNSSRNTGTKISNEKLQTAAGELLDYTNHVKQTVTRLQLINGCSDTEISFLYDSDGDGVVETNGQDWYYNPNAPLDNKCNVFDKAGGGLFVKAPLSKEYTQQPGSVNATTTTWYNSYAGRSIFIPGNATGASQNDLLLIVPFLSKELCDTINQSINGSSAYNWNNYYWYIPSRFHGDYTDTIPGDVSKDVNSGCSYKTGDLYYNFFQVLVER